MTSDSRRIFLFADALRMSFEPHQLLATNIDIFLPQLKRYEGEADHKLPFSAKVNNVWSRTSNPLYMYMAWRLITHMHDLTMILDGLHIVVNVCC